MVFKKRQRFFTVIRDTNGSKYIQGFFMNFFKDGTG